MRTPIKYYGGKTRMLPHILPMIPVHSTYLEAFVGGAAVFFGKDPSPMEILNDTNGNVTNFYRVMKTDFHALHEKISCTLHCEYTYNEARQIYFSPDANEIDPVIRAWAFWTCALMGFAGEVGGTFVWARNKHDNWHPAVSIANRRKQFSIYANRLSKVSIRDQKAEDLITSYSGCKDLFVYADPPYVGARQGHYEGYKQDDFNKLLHSLATMDGKFLLSSYPNEELTKFTDSLGWNQKIIEQRLGVASGKKMKQEVLTWNYEIQEECKPKTLNLFKDQPVNA